MTILNHKIKHFFSFRDAAWHSFLSLCKTIGVTLTPILGLSQMMAASCGWLHCSTEEAFGEVSNANQNMGPLLVTDNTCRNPIVLYSILLNITSSLSFKERLHFLCFRQAKQRDYTESFCSVRETETLHIPLISSILY